jgi:hypothetical protein
MDTHTAARTRFRISASHDAAPLQITVTGVVACARTLHGHLEPGGAHAVVRADRASAEVWRVLDGWVVAPVDRTSVPWADVLRSTLFLVCQNAKIGDDS